MLGFDTVLMSTPHKKQLIAIHSSGKTAVVSSDNGLYIEHTDVGYAQPVQINTTTVDDVYFFGEDSRFLAYAIRDVVSIVEFDTLTMVKQVRIRPHTLIGSQTGILSRIAAVSPKGYTIHINDDMSIHRADLKVPDNYTPIWSAHLRPIGYTFRQDDTDYILLRSTPEDSSTVSSDYTPRIMTSWYNPTFARHELYIVTGDAPHILKRVYARGSESIIENLITGTKGQVITTVTTTPDGRPISAHGYDHAHTINYSIPPLTELTTLDESIARNQDIMTSTTFIAHELAIWTQTPITPVTPSIIKYQRAGRPRFELNSAFPNKRITVPSTNTIISWNALKTKHECRLVSLYDPKRHTPAHAFIVLDDSGSHASGYYSATVEMLYELGYPVIIVPLSSGSLKSNTPAQNGTLLSSLTSTLLSQKIASHIHILGSEKTAPSAVMSKMARRNKVSDIYLFDPQELDTIPSWSKVSPSIHIMTLEDLDPKISPRVQFETFVTRNSGM